jgi:hypothetical protein
MRTQKVTLGFHGRKNNTKKQYNTLLRGEKGCYNLLVSPCKKQRVCEKSNQLMDYEICNTQGILIAKCAFQRDAKTLITILENKTYSKQGLSWDKAVNSGNTYIHLKDTSSINSVDLDRLIALLPSTKVLSADKPPKGRLRRARREV